MEYYKNSYFIDIMVNVPMEVSRESQRSTNTSEVEESADVRNTSNRSFQSAFNRIFCFSNFVLVPFQNIGIRPMSLQERLLDP